MKANELRIGNYVNNMGVMIKFDEADWDCIVSKAFSQNPMERYEPIPLTEDILLKCGFEKKNERFETVVVYTRFYLRPCYSDGFYWGFDMNKEQCDCELNDNKEVIHLHQLQNLYFALTGEELTIKL
jgi:hypothetical protein